MIPINTLQINDIMTKDILYYDSDFKIESYEFCINNDINFLPSYTNKLKIYVRDDELKYFKKKDISGMTKEYVEKTIKLT